MRSYEGELVRYYGGELVRYYGGELVRYYGGELVRYRHRLTDCCTVDRGCTLKSPHPTQWYNIAELEQHNLAFN